MSRISLLRSYLVDSGLDALYITQLSDIRWLTQFEGVFDSEPAHAVLVTRAGCYMHSDSRYEQAILQAVDTLAHDSTIQSDSPIHDSCISSQGSLQCCCNERWHIDTSTASVLEWLWSCIEGERDGAQPYSIGVDDRISIAQYRNIDEQCGIHKGVSLKVLSAPLASFRAVKDAHELVLLKEAQAITDAAFADVLEFIRPGITERELAAYLDYCLMLHGADELAFQSIVAAGARAACPHCIPSDTILRQGDMVLLDFGARKNAYCSDMTRCVSLGTPSAHQKEIVECVKEAQKEAMACIGPGVSGAFVHERSQEVLKRYGFGGKMGHALGHGVGIDIHEPVNLSPRNTQALVEGNVVTVEPGIYLPHDSGCRLEDFGVVTAQGFESFTQTPRELFVVDL